MIKLTEQDINYIVKECVNKLTLNESMTDITFHFTTYDGLKGILETNEFKLANQEEHYQKWASTTKPYYMCVTRQKYGDTGYGHVRDDFDVRITLNGRLLNQRYKTIVYDYYAQKEGLSSREQELNTNRGKLPYKQSYVENEERLLSEKPIIPNASKYILRIDIHGSRFFTYIKDYKQQSQKLGLEDKIFFYTNKNNFDIQNNKCTLLSETLDFSEVVKQKFENGEDISDLFDSIGAFNDNIAKVSLKNRFNFINRKGDLLSKKWFNDAEDFHNGFAKVTDTKAIDDFGSDESFSDIFNLIDTKGNLLSDKWYDDIGYFKDGIAKVRLGFKYNFIDINGKIISDEWFTHQPGIYQGYLFLLRKYKYNLMDFEGNLLFKQDVNEVQVRENFLLIRSDEKYNIVKKGKGLLVGNPDDTNTWFDWVGGFENGYARVQLNGKWNFIDTEGNIFYGDPNDINTWFDGVTNFGNGYAIVSLNNKYNFIDTEGNLYDENKNRIE